MNKPTLFKKKQELQNTILEYMIQLWWIMYMTSQKQFAKKSFFQNIIVVDEIGLS